MASKAETKEVRGIAVQFGRALSLTIAAAETRAGSLEKAAMFEAMDDAWTSLADKLMAFAEDN